MIRLNVEPYCDGCDAFEPVAETINLNYATGEYYCSETVVRCQYQRRCAKMMQYLERKMQNELQKS